ncbi:MAG: hydroxysqualene dehydroxylase HpnE [Phycisphaeraceae bacterium]
MSSSRTSSIVPTRPSLETRPKRQPVSAGDPERVVVLGGGLAGLAAAVRLAEHGLPVTLVETRKKLGGRATSFTDPATGDTLDNCQHVLMRGCTNLIDFYQRLGVDDRLEWHRSLFFADRQGHVDRFEADDLPAPLHLVRPMLSMQSLKLREKLAIARGMLAVMQVSRRRRETLSEESFADWLVRQHQPPGAVEKFWAHVVISACNEVPERVAASYAIQVFQEGFLYSSDAYEMALPRVPLRVLYDPAKAIIERHRGEVLLGASAERLVAGEGGRVRSLRLTSGENLAAGAFVSSVPFDRLAKLVDPEMVRRDDRLQRLEQMEVSPIIAVHLFFRRSDGRPVMDLPHLSLMGSPLHWIFNKTGALAEGGAAGEGSRPGGPARPQLPPAEAAKPVQHLHGVISAAHDLVAQPSAQIISLAVAETRRALPWARDAELVHARVVKEKRATFSIAPGTDRLRPLARGTTENLYLAGDWVRTGWPATMEGAVRSGYRAAEAVLRDRGASGTDLMAQDIQPGRLYRWLSG